MKNKLFRILAISMLIIVLLPLTFSASATTIENSLDIISESAIIDCNANHVHGIEMMGAMAGHAHSDGTFISKTAANHTYKCSGCSANLVSTHTFTQSNCLSSASCKCSEFIPYSYFTNHTYSSWTSNGNGTHSATCINNRGYSRCILKEPNHVQLLVADVLFITVIKN